jgi:hypothetical protein
MKSSALGALAALTLVAFAAGSARAGDPPYPPSKVITGVDWDKSSYRWAGDGGDIWATASASDGNVYAAWGDGKVTCRDKVSYGVAALPAKPSAVLTRKGCGPKGSGKGKLTALAAIGTTLYATANLQDAAWPNNGVGVWRSTDKGGSWSKTSWKFSGADLRPVGFVHFDASGDGVSGGYVYMTAMKAGGAPKAVYLMRAPSDALASKSAYQYYAGSSWSPSPGAARPVFADPAGTNGASILYNAGLHRYILTLAHGANCGHFGMFEAASLTGPWYTVEYEDRWLGVSGGDFLGARLPSRWVQDRGRTLWAVFSCYGSGSGVYHDRLNLMKATLRVAGG